MREATVGVRTREYTQGKGWIGVQLLHLFEVLACPVCEDTESRTLVLEDVLEGDGCGPVLPLLMMGRGSYILLFLRG
jgi:hypothetical protein